MTWRATVLTIFPEMLPGPLAFSLAGKALSAGLWRLETVDIRDFARDKHRSVDDAPYGGGPGMVMRPDVLDAAIAGAGGVGPLMLLSPRGRPLDQRRVAGLAAAAGVTLICGRFEGVDERVIEARAIEEVSLGDFVLSGGEPAAIALIDACVRLLPGVVGDAAALAEESFAEGLLEYPQYTRPQLWQGRAVPEVLVSGDHRAHPRLAPGRGRAADPRAPWRFVATLSGNDRRCREAGAGNRSRGRVMNLLQQLEREQVEKLAAVRPVPKFEPGDTVRVSLKVVEGERERIQAFEGVCIARKNAGVNSNFTLRKISYGEGVERVFPLYSPRITAIEVVRRGVVRRAKLYYLRGLTGKRARIAERARDSVASGCGIGDGKDRPRRKIVNRRNRSWPHRARCSTRSGRATSSPRRAKAPT